MSKSKSAAISDKSATSPPADARHTKDASGKAMRETVESIAVAVILAFLFRAFVAEAFVIPTGSMAPTLQGRHMDVTCVKCGCPYRTGASVENDGEAEVLATTCPICRYVMDLEKARDPNQRSFNGDRILVSKFAYEISDPKRWDVIVFKYPGNAKINYIKRLVGLPNETLRIRHGDIYRRDDSATNQVTDAFQIVRKPPYKLAAMLQMVDDTKYRAQELTKAGWPERWQDWTAADESSCAWKPAAGGSGFETEGRSDGEAWLRYRHVVPWDEDWQDLADGKIPQRLEAGAVRGQLISDYYAYNDGNQRSFHITDRHRPTFPGLHWVGDLAVECEDLQVNGDSGAVLLDLVEGGVHYTCRIDVASGEAVLAIDGGRKSFSDETGQETQNPKAKTKLRGPGSYDLRFANCDDQLVLWVNGTVAEFDGPTTYVPDANVKPAWSPGDPADLEPVGIGSQGVKLSVARLRVLRDVYYVAASSRTSTSEYNGLDYQVREHVLAIRNTLADPESWGSTDLFDRRSEYVEFEIGSARFFPLGDNSPQSQDARMWAQYAHIGAEPDPPAYVERDLLTGKALMIYWPHAWRRPIPFFPNFRRMGLIR
jgi:signal peptidase I